MSVKHHKMFQIRGSSSSSSLYRICNSKENYVIREFLNEQCI